VAAKLIAGVRDAPCAYVKADDERFLVLRLVEEEVLGAPGHQAAVTSADFRALRSLPDDAMTLEIDGDLVAAAVQMLGVPGPRPKNRVENGRGAAIPPRDRQPELGNRPALAFLHVLGTDIVDVHQRILESHGLFLSRLRGDERCSYDCAVTSSTVTTPAVTSSFRLLPSSLPYRAGRQPRAGATTWAISSIERRM